MSLFEDARMIHDLSYPVGNSVNDNTVDDGSVTIQYDGPHALARRVLEVESESPGHTKLLSGDVNGAFRNVPLHADHVGRFAGVIRELNILVIDLACPFGWTLSPVKYWLAGGAIAHLYSTAKPDWSAQPAHAAQPFDAKTWCDDHNAIEADIDTRLFEADLALREEMVVVLGPDAIKEDKFTTWQTTGKALGLNWNIHLSYVAMPPEKIAKALLRVEGMLATKHTSKSDLEKLMGSLRHVVACVRSAAPFFQRLASLCRSIRRFRRASISNGARDDLRWFRLILNTANLNWIPLSRFAHTQPPDVDVFMDASDVGLCALCPSRKEYIQVVFDTEERDQINIFHQDGDGDYGINLRELMSAVFACAVWGPHWTSSDPFFQMHIRLWIDNQSAVSWNNKWASRNVTAQLLLRLLGLVEIRYNFFATAAHIPGVKNIMADAGSRVWQSTSKAEEFANLSCVGRRFQFRATTGNYLGFGSYVARRGIGQVLPEPLSTNMVSMEPVVRVD